MLLRANWMVSCKIHAEILFTHYIHVHTVTLVLSSYTLITKIAISFRNNMIIIIIA